MNRKTSPKILGSDVLDILEEAEHTETPRRVCRWGAFGCCCDPSDQLLEEPDEVKLQARTAGLTPNEVPSTAQVYEQRHKSMVATAVNNRAALYDLMDAIDTMPPDHVAKELQRRIRESETHKISLSS